MKFIYVEDRDGSTGYLIPQHLNFCKRDFRTPAWVYNVIMSAWIIVRSGTLGDPSGEFLSSGVFYPQVVDQTSSWPTSLEFFPPLTSSKVVEGALMVSFIGNLLGLL
jgi:hypothetical protein